MPSACIYKQWFHCHSLEPDFEFGHYFANVVRVSSTGPASVSSLLRMHASLYEQITSLHTRLGSGEMARVDKARGMVWPDPDYYKPMPLCRAIITVLDRRHEDGFVNIKEAIHQQTLLMILTGDISGLSAPVSFESIESECLPLESHELPLDDPSITMVRVTVGTAVKFISDLDKRERAAYPELRNHSIDMELCPPRYKDEISRAQPSRHEDVTTGKEVESYTRSLTPDDWADGYIRSIEKEGTGNDRLIKEAIDRIKTVERGEVWQSNEMDSWLGRTAEPPWMGPWD